MTKGPEKPAGQWHRFYRQIAPRADGWGARALCYPARMRRLLSGMALVLLVTSRDRVPFRWPGAATCDRARRSPRRPRSTATSRRPIRTSRGRSCASFPADGATATLLEMTSQQWLTEKEVERPLWTHWLTVVRPDEGDERHRPALHRRRQQRTASRRRGRRPGSSTRRATPAR